jgi:twitching motility two-component system response regulator PilG
MKLRYEARQLKPLLEELRRQSTSGIVYLDIRLSPEKPLRSRLLVLRNGELVYGGTGIPSNQELAKTFVEASKQGFLETALKVLMPKMTNPASVRELLEPLTRLFILKWETIEAAIHRQVLLILEQALPHSGHLQLDRVTEFDLCFGEDSHGLDWWKLMADLTHRQQQWDTLDNFIPSLGAVPRLPEHASEVITDTGAYQQLQQWTTGYRSLAELADDLHQDPLELAQSFLPWVQVGWVVFRGSEQLPPTSQYPEQESLPVNLPSQELPSVHLPIVLSVDDSPVAQALAKRILSDRYQMMLASNAVDALRILNQYSVALLLLDVTMPEIDGLEFCRTLRTIAKFQDLPVIMVTARDGLVDKVKGQFAGSTYYLTKPFEPETLLNLVDKYVSDQSAT